MAKILPLKKLLKKLSKVRYYKKIVFTNGCFDILHLGHIDLLLSAKRLGDILVVGLNSDFSVKMLKGNNRPINSEFHRAMLLSYLDMIDYIVMFDEQTPLKLIKAINPDCLVKGGDYNLETVVGSDIVKDTILIPIGYQISTTKIINKILSNPACGELSCQPPQILLPNS